MKKKMLDVYKRQAQNVQLSPEMEEEPDANSLYDQMIHDERMNIINILVNELPEKQRLIMQLLSLIHIYIAGLTIQLLISRLSRIRRLSVSSI